MCHSNEPRLTAGDACEGLITLDGGGQLELLDKAQQGSGYLYRRRCIPNGIGIARNRWYAGKARLRRIPDRRNVVVWQGHRRSDFGCIYHGVNILVVPHVSVNSRRRPSPPPTVDHRVA